MPTPQDYYTQTGELITFDPATKKYSNETPIPPSPASIYVNPSSSGKVGLLSTESAANTVNKQVNNLDGIISNRASSIISPTIPKSETSEVKSEPPSYTFLDPVTGAEYTNPTEQEITAKKLVFSGGTAPKFLSETPEQKALNKQLEQNENLLNTFLTELDTLKTQGDVFTQQTIVGIQNNFNVRRAEMAEINRRREASLRTSGVRSGAERYSTSFGGILSEEERQGIRRLTELDSEESLAILEAKKLQQAQQWDLFNSKMNIITKIQESKTKRLEELNKAVIEKNKLIAEEAKELRTREIEKNKTDTEKAKNLAGVIMANLTGNETEKDFQDIADIYDVSLDKIYGALDEYKQKQFDSLKGDIGEWQSAIRIGAIPKDTTLEEYQFISDPALATDIAYKQSQTAKNYADMKKIADENAIATGVKVDPKVLQERIDTVNLINQALSDENLSSATGAANLPFIGNVYTIFGGSDTQRPVNIVSQIVAKLALGNREKIKGTGQISDFESKTLERAASSFGLKMNDEDARKALVDVRGSIITMSGGKALIKLTDPITGEVRKVDQPVDSAQIQKMIEDGLVVEYVEN